jgi:signal transduction histidine kinase/ActR/RegA family two-component response regulator
MAFHAITLTFGWGVEATFFVYMLAMLVGAWHGYGPGVLVTSLVIGVLPFMFQPNFTIARINLIGLACLTLMSLVVSRTAARQRRAEHELRALAAALESRVRDKTRDLEALVAREQAGRAEREALLARERAAHAAAETANRLKDEFLAAISHELRGPLQGIAGFSQLLASGSLSAPQATAARDAIDRNVRALTSIIDELLDVSRIVSGKMALEITDADLVGIVNAAVENVRPLASEKRIHLTVSGGGDVGRVAGDPARLQQAVWNLLSNAVKFTPEGGRVTIRFKPIGGSVEIEVSDTGVGISPDFLPHLFERFRQAESSSTRVHGGLGLGLSIVRHIVEAHGGTVQAASDGRGRGATFRILLPSGALTPRATPDEPADALPLDALLGLRVLVVDDQIDARDTIGLALERFGARVQRVESVKEALDSLTAVPPDLVVSDLAMPGADGFDLLRALRAETSGARIPAIAVTAFASDTDRARTIDAGFAAHFVKPVDLDRLISSVASLTGRSLGDVERRTTKARA